MVYKHFPVMEPRAPHPPSPVFAGGRRMSRFDSFTCKCCLIKITLASRSTYGFPKVQMSMSLTPSLYKFLQRIRPVDALLYSVCTVFGAIIYLILYSAVKFIAVQLLQTIYA